jgi:ribonuclease P protein component
VEEKNCQRKAKKRSDHRLKKNSQFQYIYRKGERAVTKNFILFSTKSKYPNYKIGYSVSKKIGKAWKRNLLRRRLREIIRLNLLPQSGFNYVLQAREGAGELSYKELESQIIKIFEKGKRV